MFWFFKKKKLMPATQTKKEQEEERQNLSEEISKLKRKLTKTSEKMILIASDAQSVRKRYKKELADAQKYAAEKLAKDMIELADVFQMAKASLPEETKQNEAVQQVMDGLDGMEQLLLKAFNKHGIKQVKAMNKPFNPEFHEALNRIPDTSRDSGTIVQVHQNGYTLHDRLLRPARVGIAQ